MADIKGIGIDFAPSADFADLVTQLTARVVAGDFPDWSVDGACAVPANALAIVNTAGDQWFLADHALVGGLTQQGAALLASHELVGSWCPGGGTTDIRAGSAVFGARWFGWAYDVHGGTALQGRMKVHCSATWFYVRFKDNTGKYKGSHFGGPIGRQASRQDDRFEGQICMGGYDSLFTNASLNSSLYVEVDSVASVRLPARLLGADAEGLDGAYGVISPAGGGPTKTTFCPVAVCFPDTAAAPGNVAGRMGLAGVLPHLDYGVKGILAFRGQDAAGANTVRVCLTGGAHWVLDDGAHAE